MYRRKPETFEQMIEPIPSELQRTAVWLRELIRTEFADLDERIYGGKKVANALYSVGEPDRVALGIQPTTATIKLFIHDPELLGSPPFKLEGSGRHMRHIKFAQPPVERRDALVSLMLIPVSRRRSGDAT